MIFGNNINTRTKIIASIAIFSALYAVLRPVPIGLMIGLGERFSVSDFLAPLYGIILGPYIGGLSIITGTFMGMLGKPPVFLGLDFLPALINTISIGYLIKQKRKYIISLNLLLIIFVILNPFTTLFIGSIPFFWLHIIALLVLISPLGHNAGNWVKTLDPKNLTIGIATLAFIGTMMQHLTGVLLTELVFGHVLSSISLETFSTIIWPSAFLLYPWERIALIILSVIIGVPVIKTLKKSQFLF